MSAVGAPCARTVAGPAHLSPRSQSCLCRPPEHGRSDAPFPTRPPPATPSMRQGAARQSPARRMEITDPVEARIREQKRVRARAACLVGRDDCGEEIVARASDDAREIRIGAIHLRHQKAVTTRAEAKLSSQTTQIGVFRTSARPNLGQKPSAHSQLSEIVQKMYLQRKKDKRRIRGALAYLSIDHAARNVEWRWPGQENQI